MRIVHWTLGNGSGLNKISTTLSVAERQLGLDSVLCYTDGGSQPAPLGSVLVKEEDALISDVHVLHSHIPDKAKGKSVFIPHGTPEHCFQITVEQMRDNYAGGDSLMMSMYWLNRADAVATFWERHKYIWQSMSPKQRIEVIPMGVETEQWGNATSAGKYAGTPSILNLENGATIKWPLDIFLMWPMVMKEMPEAILHAFYLPHNMHRFWYPLIYATGVGYKSYTAGTYMNCVALRNAFKSVDFYLSPVRYGDHNATCLEAKATGCKVISYKGNPYADYWISEGDQRVMAEEVIAIMKGYMAPRATLPISDIKDTALAMKGIYESL
jgi:hypothetical protein